MPDILNLGRYEHKEVTLGDLQYVSTLLKLIQLKRSPNQVVETEGDWDIIKELFKFWSMSQPKEYNYLITSISSYRNTYSSENNKFGEMKYDNGKSSQMELRHALEIPEKFYKIFTSVYPKQQWDRSFINKMIKEIPALSPTGMGV